MTSFEAAQLANVKMYMHGLIDAGWKFEFHNKKRAYGTCYYGRKVICLSSFLLPFMSDEAVLDTILHEIAHALCPKHGHDKVWKLKCIQIGGNGQRCGNLEEKGKDGLDMAVVNSKYKYTLTCPSCEKSGGLSRRPKRASSCSKCSGGTYQEKYRLILRQNY